MIDSLPFSPISIEIAPKRFRTIDSVAQAADFLLAGWEGREKGSAYRIALRRCLAALEGRIKPESARAAFLEALREARIFVRTRE